MIETIDESIYDHPKYYDLVFGADVAAETKFILGCADQFCDHQARRFFEPACGTGRLVHSLVRKGHETWGLDLNPRAVDFCNARLSRHGYGHRVITADMCDFDKTDFASCVGLDRRRLRTAPFDVAFNTINSFRHVGTEKLAQAHFAAVARVIRPGGLYLLGIHLTPTKVAPSETESWSARRGSLSINTHMWTVAREPQKRLERFGIYFDIHTPRRSFRINDELHLRSYTAPQMRRTFLAGGHWDCIATYDFGYDLGYPIDVDATTEDVVYVLRRTG